MDRTVVNSEAADRPRLRLVEWKPLVKNTLRGFVSVELPNGLTIREMPVLVGKNGPWVSLPAKPQIDGGDQVRRDPNGKIAYVALLQWRSKELADRFSQAVIDLLLTHHSRALSGGSAAP
jgi:DNA-binding cell septation regulator SpoVG